MKKDSDCKATRSRSAVISTLNRANADFNNKIERSAFTTKVLDMYITG